MAKPISPDYGQQFLFPPALEDWVAADHPVRFLREFVEQLDLAALGFVLPQATEGRPPYHPSLLLKIWLYGYFQRIRSTRKLEAACAEHLPLVWLSGLITPDHNSLWRFWRDNKVALRQVFKQTVHLAVQTGAVGLALQAVDGTKIQAAGSSAKGWSKEYMQKLLAQLDRVLEETELKIVAESAPAEPAGYRLPAGLAQRQALRAKIQAGLAQLQADGRNHYHPVEPETRRMKVGQVNRFGYNAQAVSNQGRGIIITACDATRQEVDNGQLVPMLEQSKANVAVPGASPLSLADTGYGAGADLAAAAQAGFAVLAPPPEGKPAKANPYAAQHFTYRPESHQVLCPQGQKLQYEGHTTKKGLRVHRFRCHCKQCPVRARCTRDPKGRQIEVWPYTTEVQAMRQRLKEPAQAALYALRSPLIERSFALIKVHEEFRRWTVWGLEGVKTQWALLCATLNLRVLYREWRAARPGSGPVAGALARMARGARRAAFAVLLSWGAPIGSLSTVLVWSGPESR
jgi:transposase